MAITTETLYRKLYDNLESKGYNPTAQDATTGKEVVPEESDFIEMDVESDGGKTPVTLTVAKDNDKFSLTVYFTDAAKENATDDWYEILKDLRFTARSSGIKKFVLRNRSHLGPDLQKRTYMKKQEQIAEGYYPMGKKGSYNDSIPSVKIVIEHTRQIEEGEQRFRNINRIFLENEQGERILAPTTKPGIAKVYARLIAEGDLPHGERWNHINGLVEEYSKMSGFVRATRGHQFNESAQKLVESGIAHYQSLRETLSRMIGRKGYNQYFESWTPPLMEDEDDTSNLNELFVQETLDPRIESVMPILSKLQKSISEMSEVSELAEWADNLLEGGDGGEASEEPEEQIEEGDSGQEALNPVGIPEEQLNEIPDTQFHEEVDMGQYDAVKSTPNGKEDDDVFKRFREKIRQYGDELEQRQKEKDVDEGQQWPDTSNSLAKRGVVATDLKGAPSKAGRTSGMTVATRVDPSITSTKVTRKDGDRPIPSFLQKEEDLNEVNPHNYDSDEDYYDDQEAEDLDLDKFGGDWDIPDEIASLRSQLRHTTSQFARDQIENKIKRYEDIYYGEDDLEEGKEFAGDFKTGPEGQWRNKGPKANKPAQVGDLVGASESAETDEEAITESEGRPYVCVHAKKGQCNVTANSSYEAAQKAAKKWGLKSTSGIDAHVADKPKDPASLEEGQEDLEAILRLIK